MTAIMSPSASLDIVVAVACNSQSILDANLRRSPMIADGRTPLHIEWNAPSAAVAYNRALDATTAKYIVFAHQDVFLPSGWDERLSLCIEELDRHDRDWAMVGPFGMGLDWTAVGPVWSTSLGSIVGKVATGPTLVQSYDELLMVVRRSAGLRFDEQAPNFHFYGTDIVQTARALGKNCYVMSLPTIHNDRFHGQLGQDFSEAYTYMRRKWRKDLPLRTPIMTISWHGLHLQKSRWTNRKSLESRRDMAGSIEVDPKIYASLCGWDDVALPISGACSASHSNLCIEVNNRVEAHTDD